MGRELWAELSAIVCLIERDFVDDSDFSRATAVVVRYHLWATLHDRPTPTPAGATALTRRTASARWN